MNIMDLLLVLLSMATHEVLRATIPLIEVERGHHSGLAIIISVHRASHYVRYIAGLSIMMLLLVVAGKCDTMRCLAFGRAQKACIGETFWKLVILTRCELLLLHLCLIVGGHRTANNTTAAKIERLWSRARVLLRDRHLLKQLPVLKDLLLDASLLLLIAVGALYKHLYAIKVGLALLSRHRLRELVKNS